MQVVLKALSLVTLAFPKILELFDIQAFDLYKVIESFVRCAPSLPYLLRQHLHQLEDQVPPTTYPPRPLRPPADGCHTWLFGCDRCWSE